MNRKSYRTTTGIWGRVSVGGGGASKMLKFVKVLYLMGKVLSGELSCTQTGLVRIFAIMC